MKVPLSWLREFVTIDADLEELRRRLTVGGIEVEAVESLKSPFSGVVVAKVLKVERHPNADRLSLCEVDAGEAAHFSVVCGATNVRRGMKAALAKIGATLAASGHGGEQAPPPLQATEIRGVRSEGMLCSEKELGFSGEHRGIMELETNAPLGADLAAYLGLED